jgi:fused signal recognition particle receptor
MADFLNKWKNGLERTRKVAFGRLANFFGATEITIDTWDELESVLIQADIGIETTGTIIADLINKVENEGIITTADLRQHLALELQSKLIVPEIPDFSAQKPAVIMVVGVNGSGKTTTLAKLGKKFKNQEQRVLFAAADTYRAAAVEQLEVWGDRLGIPVIAGQPNADPGAVAYDAVQAGISKQYDLVFVDTAGRLHTRFNLMEELKKVNRVISKALPGAPHATWLILDATTGQNALMQARALRKLSISMVSFSQNWIPLQKVEWRSQSKKNLICPLFTLVWVKNQKIFKNLIR